MQSYGGPRRSLRQVTLSVITVIGAAMLAIGCASGEGIPPSGGPPDREAPLVRQTDPADGITNFDGDRVEIEFSEGIDEGGVRDEVIVTPIPARSPSVTVSGRTLRIDFRDELLADRTYAVTIGGGIRDYAGNRLGTPVTLRFSTGDIIDSGRIGGTVVGEERAAEARFVFAWRTDDATSPDGAAPPDFIVPVSDNGRFSLEGLPAGTYRLAAVDDQRRDRAIDPGEDRVGVGPETITIGAGQSYPLLVNLRLPPSASDLQGPSLFTVSSDNRRRTTLRFSEPIDTADLRVGNVRLTQNGAPVAIASLWRSASTPANVQLLHAPLTPKVEATIEVTDLRDTAGNRLIDSTRIRSFTAGDRVDTVGPSIAFVGRFGRGLKGGDTIRMVADEGVEILDRDNGLVVSDTAGAGRYRYRIVRVTPVDLLGIPVDTISSRLGAARLVIDQTSFRDLLGNRGSGRVDTIVPVAPTPQLGTLSGRLVDSLAPTTPHVIVLTDEFNNSYRVRLPGTGPWSIENIPSGAYRLEAFRDVDNDGELDYGTLSPWTPAEPSMIYPGGIRVRPRWTTTETDLVF